MNKNYIDWDELWVSENFDRYDSLIALNEAYNRLHGTCICYRTFKGFCQRNGYKKCNISAEQDAFIREAYPKYGAKKTAELFNQEFGTHKTFKQIRTLAHNRHLKIEDGEVFYDTRVNKRGCKYKVGEVSQGWKEPYVKIGDNKWIREGVYNYVNAYGEVPEGYIVINLDMNHENNSPENLAAIPKRYSAKLMRNKLYSHNATVTKAVLMLLELEDKISESYMDNQIKMFDTPKNDIEKKIRRSWENAFQKWSNEQFKDGATAYGACGYGSICDWCTDNSYGRPCVRALNAMCREKRIRIDYTDYDFTKVW